MRYGWLLAAPLLSALQLPPAPAPPRSAAVRMTLSAAPQPNALPPLEFGRDPRESQLSDEKLAQLAEACKPVNPASASTSDSVTPVLTIEDFEAALAHSASRGRLTVFKFYAPWCPTVLTRDHAPEPVCCAGGPRVPAASCVLGVPVAQGSLPPAPRTASVPQACRRRAVSHLLRYRGTTGALVLSPPLTTGAERAPRSRRTTTRWREARCRRPCDIRWRQPSPNPNLALTLTLTLT